MNKSKRRVKKFLARKFFIRFHMSIILISTILVGLITTNLLLSFNVDDVRIRYPLVVVVSYLAFIIFIRIWLYYIKYRDKILENALDALDIPFHSSNTDSTMELEQCIESGSSLSKDGEGSGSFDLPENSILGDGASSIGDAADFLEEGAIILIPLMILLAFIFGAGVWLIYEAPIILSEVAFEFILASILIKKAKEIDSPDWIGSVIRTTWLPFVITITLAILFAFILHNIFPEISSISQIFK